MPLAEGEVLAIIGANGAGKTTLAALGLGPDANAAAQIRYRGDRHRRRCGADRVRGRGIALVPEGRQLFPSLSVEENLLIGGRMRAPGRWSLHGGLRAVPDPRANGAAIPSTSLSGGQQQMVAIGRALMSNPDLILFDEISLGLAPVIIKDIYAAAARDHGATACRPSSVEQDISQGAVGRRPRSTACRRAASRWKARPRRCTRGRSSPRLFRIDQGEADDGLDQRHRSGRACWAGSTRCSQPGCR